MFYQAGFILLVFINFYSTANPECDLKVYVSRYIENDGFHRNLKIDVEVDNLVLSKLNERCQLAIYQPLPRNLYVDKEQLNGFQTLKEPSTNIFYVNETVDIEASEDISSPINVFVINNGEYAPPRAVIGRGLTATYEFTLPVHVRYHLPQFLESSRTITIPDASVLCRCDLPDSRSSLWLPTSCVKETEFSLPCSRKGYNDYGKTESCGNWYELMTTNEDDDTLLMTVPVGDMKHLFLVQLMTMSVTNLAAVYLVYFLLYKF